MNFQVSGNNQIPNNFQNQNYENNEFNLFSSINLVDNLLDSLDKNLSESVYDLTRCFICLGQTEEPLSCPNCNNFACKKCLENYFNGQIIKNCPICKKRIFLNDFKKNEIISEIDKILNKNDTKKNKFEELSKLIKEKKDMWERNGEDLNIIINKILKYQDSLREYKKQFFLFLSECKSTVEKAFEEYNKKVEEIMNSLSKINKDVKNTIVKCNNIDQNNINNYYNDNKIKDLINEILSMERKHFNHKGDDNTEKLLNTPIKIYVSMNEYLIHTIVIKKQDLGLNFLYFKNNHKEIGDFELKYKPISFEGYKVSCALIINFKNNFNANFYITQNIKNINNVIRVYPMKFKSKIGKSYVYENTVYFDDFKDGKKDQVEIDIFALAFFVK